MQECVKQHPGPPPVYNAAEVNINHGHILSNLEGSITKLANLVEASLRGKKRPAADIVPEMPGKPQRTGAGTLEPAAVNAVTNEVGENLLCLDEK